MMVPELTCWQQAPLKPSLTKCLAHLWRFRLDLSAAELARLQQLLDVDERFRANRLLDPLQAGRFIAARGRLRQILARYLDIPPGSLVFFYEGHGKPGLANVSGGGLAFNLSHAGEWGLLGVADSCAVGVDLEVIDPQLDYDTVARYSFPPAETACLQQLHHARRRHTFFRLWTRMEARLKGQGGGFSAASTDRHGTEWTVRSFSVGRRYVGALAFAGRVDRVLRWNFD